MQDLVTIADGLRFPEGPIAMADGSVILAWSMRMAASGSPITAKPARACVT